MLSPLFTFEKKSQTYVKTTNYKYICMHNNEGYLWYSERVYGSWVGHLSLDLRLYSGRGSS